MINRAIPSSAELPHLLRAGELTPEQIQEHIERSGWRISPLATGLRFGEGEYQHAPHLKILSDAIVDGVMGLDKSMIIVSMPPRHGKSWTVSKYTPPWFLGNWPNKHVMNCGYGTSFAKEWGREVRNLCVKNKEILGFSLADDSQSADVWHTESGGGMVAAGIGGAITGKGADLLIIDDPIKNDEEAYSFTYRDKIWNWWQKTAQTRLHPGGVCVIVMTRWHEDDLVGRLLSPDYPGDPDEWRVINMPAIWEKAEPDEVLGRVYGDPLWPEMRPLTFLQRIKSSVDHETWVSLYQGEPASSAGLGNVYHAFDAKRNIDPGMQRDPEADMFWSVDFNVDPMSSVVGQFRYKGDPLMQLISTVKNDYDIDVLDEISLPDSNTPEACAEFHHRVKERGWYRGRQLTLHIFGDVSGNARSTTGAPSDWQIIRQYFNDPERKRYYKVQYHIGKKNPAVRDRTNAVNAALCTAGDRVSMRFHPRCKELQRDMEDGKWKRDTSGNITGQLDKRDSKRTHLSDALGYVVYGRSRLKPAAGEKTGLMQ